MTNAWYDPTNQHVSTDKHDPLFTPLGQLWPLCTKREWVGLTDAEIDKIVDAHTYDDFGYEIWTDGKALAQAIEAALKEKA
jgi:hypothetical protein